MIIAINTRTISGNERVNQLLVNYILRLASLHPEHQFILISQKEILPLPDTANVKVYLLPQQSDNVLLWKLWYHYKLPSAVRKLKADLLLSTDGILSKRIKIPQYLLVTDIGFLSSHEQYTANYARFAKLNAGEFFRTAKKLIVFTDHIRNEILKHFKVSETKISIWYPGISTVFKPVSIAAKDVVKEQHTDGKDYFLWYGSVEDKSRLVNIVKAFSLFKRRLKTNMQLMLASPEIPAENEFIKSLSLYKYRDDVRLVTIQDETILGTMIGAAYACINLSPSIDDSIFLLESIHSGVPVIAGNYHSVISLVNNTALFADPSSLETIAEKMMLLYKDEKRRFELIQLGLEQAKLYDEKKSTAALGKLLLQ